MAEKQEYFWEAPPLSAEDQKLRDAYVRVGQLLDRLAYTEAFDQLVVYLGAKDSQEERYNILQRLLYLRKRGRLPRVGGF